MGVYDRYDHGDDAECSGCGKKRVIGMCGTCYDKDDLRRRVAKALGCSIRDVENISFHALQERLVNHQELSSECGRAAERWEKEKP